MTTSELINLIDNTIQEKLGLDENTPLIGINSSIDSMNLVQICIALEEKSEEEGFEFDWKSEKAMSVLNSIFRNPKALTEEYNRQMKQKSKK